MARSKRQAFRVVLFKEGKTWSAQCLEFDIATQAKTPRDLAFAIACVIAPMPPTAWPHAPRLPFTSPITWCSST